MKMELVAWDRNFRVIIIWRFKEYFISERKQGCWFGGNCLMTQGKWFNDEKDTDFKAA